MFIKSCLCICLILICLGMCSAQEQEEVTEEVAVEVQEPGLPPAVQEFFQKEMEKLPPVERHFRMAQHYHASGMLKEAIGELGLALKEDPEHVPSNCELGVIYMGQGDYDKAIAQLQKTLDLDPEYPKTHYALANAYARKPEPDVALARKHLDEAVRLGYHAVPWFLEYIKRLEISTGRMPVLKDGKKPVTPEPGEGAAIETE